MLKGLRDSLLNVLTLGEHEHPGGLREYGSQQLHALDPRTPEGLASLAAMFVPGPGGRGGKFVGQLNERQLAFLNQLHNVHGGRPIRNSISGEMEHFPFQYRVASRTPPGEIFPLMREQIEAGPDLGPMGEALGYVQGNPLWQNRIHVDPRLGAARTGTYGMTPTRADSKLGVGRGGTLGHVEHLGPINQENVLYTLLRDFGMDARGGTGPPRNDPPLPPIYWNRPPRHY